MAVRTRLPMAWLRSVWPRSIGNQCLLMLVLGGMLGLVWPQAAQALQPLARVFLQISQIVVMPFLICELVVGFGSLRPNMMRSFVRSGLVVLVALWAAAGVLVVLLPTFLPPLVTSQFFHAGLFERPQQVDLLALYLPDNIFSGLANDNFPAVVLFSSVLGVVLQSIETKARLLEPLEVIRQLFGRLNRLVARLIPLGIFALTALNVARLDWPQLLKIQGFFQLSMLGLVLLTVLCLGTLLALVPLPLAPLWRAIRGPLVLTASSANLLIALPLLVENLRRELPAVLDPAGAEAARGQRALAGVCGDLQVLLPIEGLVDLDALRGRLEKDIAKADREIKGLAGRLANPNFADKAPPEVVLECKANLAEAEAQAALARRRLGDLG